MVLILQFSFGPIGWLMISEIFPLRLRGRGLSIAVLVNFAANALVTFSFSPLEVRETFSNVFLPTNLQIFLTMLFQIIKIITSLISCGKYARSPSPC